MVRDSITAEPRIQGAYWAPARPLFRAWGLAIAADTVTLMRPRKPTTTIYLHVDAPAKPATGAACNGCGLCCAAAPCPMGALLSRRLTGACAALEWDATARRYHCGVITAPRRWLPWLPAAWGRRLALRWIAASIGCDATLMPV